MTQQTRDYFLSLPYTIEVTPIKPEDGGGCTACIPLLGRHTCVGDGETCEEAIRDLRDTQASLIDRMLAEGAKIPEPVQEQATTRGFPLRLPAELYRRIADAAKAAGVSMNRYIVDMFLKHQEDYELRNALESVRTEIEYLRHDFTRGLLENQLGTVPPSTTAWVVGYPSAFQLQESETPAIGMNVQGGDVWNQLVRGRRREQGSEART